MSSIDTLWLPFLSPQRVGAKADAGSKSRPEGPGRSEFHRDYDRIIFSSAFRRLSDKTQVVPFPQSDYTRRRLTHSLEVSCVGRSLATEIYSDASCGLQSQIAQGDFEAIVATACLAHDIGNPPFGHFGERAIQDWAKRWIENHPHHELSVAQATDLTRFEGNAQTFRVLTRLQMASRAGGMRLTAASLGAVIKYPRPSVVAGPSVVAEGSRWKKHGVFQDDFELFSDVFRIAGRNLQPNGQFGRHPLAWLSEAADDICYVIIDLEDGCKSGAISLNEGVAILEAIAPPERSTSHIPSDDRLAMARALAINHLVQQAATVFRTNLSQILDGSFSSSLVERCPSFTAYQQAREIVFEKVFRSARVLELEAGGYRAIQGLLDMLASALLAAHPNQFDRHLLALTGLTPDPSASQYQKLLACTDAVSGMTDRFCMEQFQKLTGYGTAI